MGCACSCGFEYTIFATERTTRQESPHWERISTCSLLCEEVLDTEPSPGLLTQYYLELLRRGYTVAEIQELRHFVWLTVGWLNFVRHAGEVRTLAAVIGQLNR